MEFNIDDVRMLVEEDKIQWRNHILIRMQQRGIKIKDVLDCIMCGDSKWNSLSPTKTPVQRLAVTWQLVFLYLNIHLAT